MWCHYTSSTCSRNYKGHVVSLWRTKRRTLARVYIIQCCYKPAALQTAQPNHPWFLFASFRALCCTLLSAVVRHSSGSSRDSIWGVRFRGHRKGGRTHCSLQSLYALIRPAVSFRSTVAITRFNLLTGRSLYTLLSLLHCASGILCSCLQLLDTDQSTRCMLCCSRFISHGAFVCVGWEANLSNLEAAEPVHCSGFSSAFDVGLLLIVKVMCKRGGRGTGRRRNPVV
jgi:hypothetical protein